MLLTPGSPVTEAIGLFQRAARLAEPRIAEPRIAETSPEEDWCKWYCRTHSDLGVTTCRGGNVVICICHKNIDRDLGSKNNPNSHAATAAAAEAHERAHAAGSICLGNITLYRPCGHPCAFDAEVDKWDELYSNGSCDSQCQSDTQAERQFACDNASPGKCP